MKMPLKITSLPITLILMVYAAQVYGDDNQPVEAYNSSPCCVPDYEPSPCCTPTCNPSPYCGPNCLPAPYCREFNVHGEFLYWVPELNGLEAAFGTTAVDTTTSPLGVLTTTITESDVEPDWHWSPGYRVGIDYTFLCFVLEADYTHFKGHAKFKDDLQDGIWRIKYDVVDLTFARRFCVAPCFFFKPFIGLRGARIHQSLNTNLVTDFTTGIVSNATLSNRQDSEKFWGIGPELGIEANWFLGCHLSLFASFDVVTYYGEVKSTNFDTDVIGQTQVAILHGRRKHPFNDIGTDGAVGIRYDRAWCVASEVLLMIKAGVEQHRIYDFSNLGSDGTLSLDGAFFEIGLGYRY